MIALLGLTPGTYVDYWGSGGMQIRSPSMSKAPLREPTSVWLLGLGRNGLVLYGLRRRNRIKHT
jgi:hypothetical protein